MSDEKIVLTDESIKYYEKLDREFETFKYILPGYQKCTDDCWHATCDNPEDLPEDGKTVMFSILKPGNRTGVIVKIGAYEKSKNCFICDNDFGNKPIFIQLSDVLYWTYLDDLKDQCGVIYTDKNYL